MATEPLLLLFDIDGTLVTGAAEAHAQALHEALQAVHGVDARRVPIPIPPAGRTDPEISRAHAVVGSTANGLEIQDLGSLNGTWVNGERISGPARLVPGDVVKIGATRIQVVSVGDGEAASDWNPADALLEHR